MTAPPVIEQLDDARAAFDSVAPFYDGPAGNNEVVQWLRRYLWRAVEASTPPGSRLLDLGCGTGIDLEYFASRGYDVVGTDWSPLMVASTEDRIRAARVGSRARASTVGMHELGLLAGERFDAIYSDLGALNCAPDVSSVARTCHQLLGPGSSLILSVIGRVCPWEASYYLLRANPRRAFVRRARHAVPAPLNGGTVWTRYYTPAKLAQRMEPWFEPVSVRGLCLFSPPPNLTGVWTRLPWLWRATMALDERLGTSPALRGAGDHFLIVLRRRS